MPKKTIRKPGNSRVLTLVGLAVGPSNDYDDAHDATTGRTGLEAINASHTKMTILGRDRFTINRSIVVYDFSREHLLGKDGSILRAGLSGVPRNVKVLNANLIINRPPTLTTTTDANANKIVVGSVFDPRRTGRISLEDYDKSRHDTSTFTKPFPLVHNTAARVPLGNKRLLREIENAINRGSDLYLCVRNQLDITDTAPTGVNEIIFTGPDADGRTELEIIFQTNSARFEQGKGAFGGSNIRNSAGKGFGTF